MKVKHLFLFLIFIAHNNYTTHFKMHPKQVSVDYILTQLDRHIRFFSYLDKQGNILDIKPTSLCLEVSGYTHELTRLCAKKIIQEQSILPLLETWDLFKTVYSEIDSLVFLQEFSTMLFCMYKDLLIQLYDRNMVLRVVFVDILDLAGKIMSLPIEQVLDALDFCYEQFLVIMHDYGLDSDLTWNQWWRAYWWVPPVVVGILIVSIIKHRMLKETYPSYPFQAFSSSFSPMHSKIK